MPAPIREQAFIFPVLTEKPSKEHKKTHTVVEKSDKKAIFESFSTIPLPRELIILLPPAKVPAIIIIPTGSDRRTATYDRNEIPIGKRTRHNAISFCPSWAPCAKDESIQVIFSYFIHSVGVFFNLYENARAKTREKTQEKSI